MDETKKIQQMAMRFGLALINRGFEITRNAGRINKVFYQNAMVKNFLSDQTGIAASSISLSDEKYYLADIDKVNEIIEMDWTNTFKYATDVWDCDNFAMLFSAEAGNLYGLNTFFVAFGGIYDAQTKQLLFRHAFNLILTETNGVMNLYLYEPQTDEISLWKKGQDNVGMSGKWIYRPDWVLGW